MSISKTRKKIVVVLSIIAAFSSYEYMDTRVVAKQGVDIHSVTDEIRSIYPIIDSLWRTHANRDSVIVTSANDSKHSYKSLHYVGLAIDVRSRDLLPKQKLSILRSLRRTLNPLGYDVLLENVGGKNEHFHIERDYAKLPKAR